MIQGHNSYFKNKCKPMIRSMHYIVGAQYISGVKIPNLRARKLDLRSVSINLSIRLYCSNIL